MLTDKGYAILICAACVIVTVASLAVALVENSSHAATKVELAEALIEVERLEARYAGCIDTKNALRAGRID